MCLVYVRVHGLVAVVALHETRQEMVNCVLDSNCLCNSSNILQKLPLLRVWNKSWILRPRASNLLDFAKILIDFLLLFLSILIVHRRPPLLYYLQRIVLLFQLVVERIDLFLCGFSQVIIDVVQSLVFLSITWKIQPGEAVQDVVSYLLVLV